MAGSRGGYEVIDLEHEERRHSIAACVLRGPSGAVVIDPGPSSTLPRLREGLDALGIREADLAGILLTHIHLDHAGSSGILARENLRLRIHVHAKGAPHLIDPTRLLNSARRLYGDRMDALWGEIAPVPAEQVVVLEGGEVLEPGGRPIEVAYTPGHAWHHVSYYDRRTGAAFVGDTAGIYGPEVPLVLPVTPPPDFDLEAWLASLDRIGAWRPTELVLTHFGRGAEPARHLQALREGLLAWTGAVEETLAIEATDQERVGLFRENLRSWIDGKVPPERAEGYLSGAGPEACWQGIARYLRSKHIPP